MTITFRVRTSPEARPIISGSRICSQALGPNWDPRSCAFKCSFLATASAWGMWRKSRGGSMWTPWMILCWFMTCEVIQGDDSTKASGTQSRNWTTASRLSFPWASRVSITALTKPKMQRPPVRSRSSIFLVDAIHEDSAWDVILSGYLTSTAHIGDCWQIAAALWIMLAMVVGFGLTLKSKMTKVSLSGNAINENQVGTSCITTVCV